MRVGFGYLYVESDGSASDEDFFDAAGVERAFVANTPTQRQAVRDQAVSFLRQGDVFVISSLSRLGNSLDAVIGVLEKIHAADATIAIGLGDSSPGADFETALLAVSVYLAKHVTGHADEGAGARGSRRQVHAPRGRGRPAVLSLEDRDRVQRLVTEQGVTTQQAAKRFGVSATTIYRILQNP